MSHTRVKTTYEVQGSFGSTETKTLYCDHNHTSDFVTYYDEDGDVMTMCFQEWSLNGKDLWDAMLLLAFPYENNDWSKGILKENVEYYQKISK